MKKNFYDYLSPVLFRLPPELAHCLTLVFLKTGLVSGAPFSHPALKTAIWGLEFENPVGLAAGFDKNAQIIPAVAALGFGFMEAGTVTPRPQKGNAKPRLFRDVANGAVINALGFPSQGLESVLQRLTSGKWPESFRVGVNIGKNKETLEAAVDYMRGVEGFSAASDFLVINISSPNTAGLRDLQKRENLLPLLEKILSAREKSGCATPLLVKISPDLDAAQRKEIAQVALEAKIDGLVVANTTLSRPSSLSPDFAARKGGLSGAPLTDMACAVLTDMYRQTQGRLPLVGAGGISSGQDAFRRICAGASLVEVYTALVFQGPDLARRICTDLASLLKDNGFSSVAQAVGSGVQIEHV